MLTKHSWSITKRYRRYVANSKCNRHHFGGLCNLLSIIYRPSLHKAIVQPGAVDGPLVVDPGH